MLKFAVKKLKKTSPLVKYFYKKPVNRFLFKINKKEEVITENAEIKAFDLSTADPSIIKLLEYTKVKKTLSYEELSDILPEHITNTDKIEQVLALLEANNIQLI